MKYRLAIFDLDGTVLNSLADLADAVNAALAKNGYPTRTTEQVSSFLGNGVTELIKRAVPTGTGERERARVHADFITHYTAHCADKTAPYAGITELLGVLRAAGMRTAVLSNKAHHATLALCKTYFEGLFDVVMGEREGEGIPKKPAPDAVFSIMQAFHATAADTIYIGDSDVDIKTAANAAVDAIGVSWGFRSAALLRASGVTIIVDTPQQLQAAILEAE